MGCSTFLLAGTAWLRSSLVVAEHVAEGHAAEGEGATIDKRAVVRICVRGSLVL